MSGIRKTWIIREQFEHMGSHSGYDLISDFLESAGVEPEYIYLKDYPLDWPVTLVIRALRKFGLVQSPWYKARNFWAETRAIRRCRHEVSTLHILYGENNLGLLSNPIVKGKSRVVVTVHQPSDWWCKQLRSPGEMFDSIDALVVLSRAEQKAFSRLTTAPVHFVPHGVDTDFFTPASADLTMRKVQRDRPRCIFVGQWLRDFATLHRVVDALARDEFQAEFDLVVPRHPGMDDRLLSLIDNIEQHPTTTSHRGLDDAALRTLYQEANFLVLPLEESTANNSILEALACGIPVITTRTSGVEDYVDSSCAMVCDAKDADGIVNAIKALQSDSDLQLGMSERARERALTHFSWSHVADKVAAIYRNPERTAESAE